MNRRKFKLLTFSLIGLLLAAFGAQYLVNRNLDLGQEPVSAKVREIEGYKSWTKVNKTPAWMHPNTAASCALPEMAGKIMVEDAGVNPHLEKFLTVYVNSIGEKAMMEQKNPDFPEGAVIVKEKLTSEESITPELMTVMIKQKKGSNPKTGDWEYLVVDGSGEKIEARGNLANCQACHEGRKTQGYVFRSYLSYEAHSKLK